MSKPIVEDDLFSDLADIERRLRQLEALRSGAAASSLLDFQQAFGNNNAYNTAGTSPFNVTIYKDLAKTQELAFTYTPPINAWWEVSLSIGTAYSTANSGVSKYMAAGIYLVPNPVSGPEISYSFNSSTFAGDQFYGYDMTRTFSLAAGVAYTVRGRLAGQTGIWSYHQGNNYLSMEAKAYPR